MRIAFIMNVFPCLSETFILNQITGLIDRGHEVDIYAQYPGNTSKIHPEVLKYRLLERTYYDVSVPHNLFKRLLKAIWLIIANFHKSPFVILRSLNVFKYSRQALSLRLLYMVLPYIGRKPYDIIHCHFGPNGLRGVRLREIGAIEGKIITTFHGYDVNLLPKRHGNGYYNEVFREVDICTTSSDFIGRRVKSLGAGDGKLVKLPVGVDTRKFVSPKRSMGHDSETIILTVGRLTECKGIEYAIRAIAKIVPKFPNTQYEIVGDGHLREQLADVNKKLGVSDHVHFLGAKTREQIVNLASMAHIFVLAGVRGQDRAEEGQGLALLEAQAMGLPVVATNVGGVPDYAINGETILASPPKNSEMLAQNIIRLIKNEDERKRIAENGYNYIKQFSWDKATDQLEAIFKKYI